ncbi:MAG: Dabb family protein [Gemmataceae bacterium]
MANKMLAHNVFFALQDNSAEARTRLVTACKKYLSTHPGTVFFSAGVLCDDLDRDVNQRDWDVGLHLVFKNKAAHDHYQEAPLHNQFIEENKGNWKKVRVFDSYVEQ